MSVDMDKRSINLFGEDGGHGGTLIIVPGGCAENTIVQVNLTYLGLANTDYWFNRVRYELESIFKKDFDDLRGKAPNIMGGKSSEEFKAELRNDWD
jgi:hypothetical protein